MSPADPAPQRQSRVTREAPTRTEEGFAVPPFTPGAWEHVTTTEHLRSLVRAYYEPDSRWPGHSDGGEVRAAQGHLIRVDESGTIVFVGLQDLSGGRPESLRPRQAPMRRVHGGGGRRRPTTYKELLDALLEMGATAVSRSPHVKLRLPNGELFMLPNSASDHRAIRNSLSDLAKLGYELRQ